MRTATPRRRTHFGHQLVARALAEDESRAARLVRAGEVGRHLLAEQEGVRRQSSSRSSEANAAQATAVASISIRRSGNARRVTPRSVLAG